MESSCPTTPHPDARFLASTSSFPVRHAWYGAMDTTYITSLTVSAGIRTPEVQSSYNHQWHCPTSRNGSIPRRRLGEDTRPIFQILLCISFPRAIPYRRPVIVRIDTRLREHQLNKHTISTDWNMRKPAKAPTLIEGLSDT